MAGPVPLSQALAKGMPPVTMPGVNMPAVNMPGMAGMTNANADFVPVNPEALPLGGQFGVQGGAFPGIPVGTVKLPVAGGAVGKSPDQNSPDPISWVFDMLDRPARAIRDSVAATTDGVTDAVKLWSDIGAGKQNHIGKDASNILGDAGEQVTAPFRGLFSTNANDQETSSQLIERGVDKWGKTLDPHYKDTRDNVNPILKGVVGFAGDVGTDPLTYMGGPILKGMLLGGKALLTGARVAKDLGGVAPAAQAIAKVADQAIGGDTKAADALESLVAGDVSDTERAAQAATDGPPPVSKVVDRPKITFQELLDTGKPEPVVTEVPEVSQPLTTEGQVSALTDAPAVGPAAVPWTLEQENALTRATKRLDKMPPGDAADKLQAKVDAWTAEKAAAHQVGTPAPEAGTPVVDAPAAPAPKGPLTEAQAQEMVTGEPQSLGDALRASSAGKNFVKAYEGAQKLAQQHNMTMLETLTKLKQQDKLSTLFGESFLQSLSRYSNPERFSRMLDDTYRVITKGGHLDDGDLETKLNGTRTMLNAVITDAGLAKEKIQTARAAFRARSAVPETASLESTLARMGGGDSLTTGLVKHLDDSDLKELVEGSFNRLRDEKPGMAHVTKGGAKSTGGDTAKSYAEYRDRLGTHNQTFDLVHASLLAAKRMKSLDAIGGARRSAMLRSMVMGIPGKAGLLDSLTRIRDELGAAHWLEDSTGRAIPMSLHQGLQILGGDPAGQRLVDKLVFNAHTPASKTNIAEALVAAAHGASRDDILAVLKSGKRFRDGDQPNFLAEGKKLGNVDYRLSNSSITLEPGETAVKNGNKGFFVKESGDSLANKTADLIVARRDDLLAQVRDNAEAYAQRFATESRDLTTAAQASIDAMRADPALLGDAVSAIAHPKKLIEAIGDSAGAREDSMEAARIATEATIPVPDQVVAQQLVKSTAAVNKGNLPAAREAVLVASNAAAKPVTEAYEATQAEAIESGALADIAHIEEKLPPAGEPPADITPETAPIGQAADPLEEVFRGAKYSQKSVSSAERIVAGEAAIHGRIQGRAMAQIQSATGLVNKASNMVREGFSFESLDTEMRTQLAQLSNKYANLLQQLHKIDAQVTDKLRVSDIVREDAFAGRVSAPEYAQHRELTDRILSHWMSVGDRAKPESMLAEPFLRGGASPEAIVKHLESSGIIPEGFKLDSDELEALVEGDRAQFGSFAGSLANLLTQKGVRIPDSYDFYTKMFGAVATYGTHAGIAQDFIDSATKLGFASTKAQSGMRRVVLDNKSIFAHFINEANIHTDPETFGALLRMSDLLDPKSRAAGELAHILQVFDDTQQLWKWGEVAIRPGTRVHNYISDHLMTWLAMGHQGFRSGYTKSLKMMAAMGGDQALTQEELVEGIQRVGGSVKDRSYGGANEVIFSGKYGSYTTSQASRLFNKSGLATSAKAIERTDKENLSGVGRFGQKVYNSRVGQGASKLTEATENQVRATHYAMALQRALETGYVTTRWGKKVSVVGKNGVDEELLAHTLGDAVRRYHPDPHMLTNTERTTIRRVLPFYSWNRGAVPAILDAMYLHPGRGLVLNKLSFAVGQSLGVQGNNLADPFPNGMWPGFLTGQAQGPQATINGQMFMANPGIPTWDVANMFTDPNNLSGSISPLIAMPLTFATGKDFRTGQPITNQYDALDQQLPVIANIEGGTGVSITGSLVGALTGNGVQKTSAAAQQQLEPGQGGISLLNYLLGSQISHVNKDSYLRAGIAQQQARLSKIASGESPSLGVGG